MSDSPYSRLSSYYDFCYDELADFEDSDVSHDCSNKELPLSWIEFILDEEMSGFEIFELELNWLGVKKRKDSEINARLNYSAHTISKAIEKRSELKIELQAATEQVFLNLSGRKGEIPFDDEEEELLARNVLRVLKSLHPIIYS